MGCTIKLIQNNFEFTIKLWKLKQQLFVVRQGSFVAHVKLSQQKLKNPGYSFDLLFIINNHTMANNK